jgi:multicomponent Na+:H+ antiporter subunit B
MRKFIGVLLMAGFAFFLGSVAIGQLWTGDPSAPRLIGAQVLSGTAADTGGINTVTAVVVQYRGLDTLGEVTVLFLSALGVALLSGEFAGRGVKEVFKDDGGFVLQTGARLILPLIVLMGVYIVIHGHLSPGGGFPGGVLVATAVYVVLMTGVKVALPTRIMTILEGFAGLCFVGLGFVGLFSPRFSFLANVFGKGELGMVFSAGIIPFIYAAVGLKVASELTYLVTSLTGSEAEPGRKADSASLGTGKGSIRGGER